MTCLVILWLISGFAWSNYCFRQGWLTGNKGMDQSHNATLSYPTMHHSEQKWAHTRKDINCIETAHNCLQFCFSAPLASSMSFILQINAAVSKWLLPLVYLHVISVLVTSTQWMPWLVPTVHKTPHILPQELELWATVWVRNRWTINLYWMI